LTAIWWHCKDLVQEFANHQLPNTAAQPIFPDASVNNFKWSDEIQLSDRKTDLPLKGLKKRLTRHVNLPLLHNLISQNKTGW
jgi:hypothetical protein